ncbi:hypothetical protein [Sediminicurvatus halobius]|uniref:Uncharacterized protein n=1 Tax=Sediminicurvatus halobius TaxID=2182432 RepID=A0A2U2N1A9_9GAMM|nr:hypothetical protein [Spiribacter halobius]PWG62837.1 hypothetical protein DEM34_10750 [Spiribacter halobius]UEX77013.1 hypothetical protein LMH63_13805 [Spiribacter halobius]
MADEPMPPWFRAVVGEGIQRLVAIGLPGGPGWDSIKLTAQAWGEALWEAPVQWDEKADSARLQAAFKRAGRTCERWPTPRQVLEMMPSRPQPRALPAPQMSRQQRERNSRRLRAALRKALSQGGSQAGE